MSASPTPASSTSSKSIPPFLRLPVELHLEVISWLDNPAAADNEDDQINGIVSVQQLRRTNYYFSTLIPPINHSTLLRLEKTAWARTNGLWSCRYCLRLRPTCKFAEKMLKGRTGRNGYHPELRFCADCGFDTAVLETRYSHGTVAIVDGERWVLCLRCREVKKGEAAGPDKCRCWCKACFPYSFVFTGGI